MTHCSSTHFHLALKKVWFFSWSLWKKTVFLFFSIFSLTDLLYSISKHTPHRNIFPTMYNMQGNVSIYCLTKKCPETIQWGWLNLNKLILSNEGSLSLYSFPHHSSRAPKQMCPLIVVQLWPLLTQKSQKVAPEGSYLYYVFLPPPTPQYHSEYTKGLND